MGARKLGILCAACALVACGDDDDGGGSDPVDAAVVIDSAVAIDAPAPPDAAPPDAALPPLVTSLYGTHDGMLVTLNLTTGAEQMVAAIDPMPSQLAFDGETLHGLINDAGTFTLATVDPCTGAVTTGATLDPGKATIFQLEGFAYSVDEDALVIAASLNAADAQSETIATVDVTTGALTVLGTVSGTLDGSDIDTLSTFGGGLLGRDATTAGGGFNTQYYDVDDQTGAATALGTTIGQHVTKLAFDADTSTVYAWQFEGANPFTLATLDPNSGALTPIGVTHAGAAMAGFTFASARCP